MPVQGIAMNQTLATIFTTTSDRPNVQAEDQNSREIHEGQGPVNLTQLGLGLPPN